MLVGTAPGRPLAAAATVSQPAGETSAEPGPEGMGPGGAAPRPLWRRRGGNGPARNGPARPLSRRSAPGSVFGSASACGAGRGAVVAVAAVAAMGRLLLALAVGLVAVVAGSQPPLQRRVVREVLEYFHGRGSVHFLFREQSLEGVQERVSAPWVPLPAPGGGTLPVTP